MMLKKVIVALILGAASVASAEDLKTVSSVDLARYAGRWYEIASIPMYFQKDCVGGTTAEYSLTEDQRVKVLNSCDTADGERKSAEGRAKLSNPDDTAKLNVTFIKIVGWIFLPSRAGNYWIIDLASDYSTAIVAGPDRETAWILSRTPILAPDVLSTLSQRLREQGIDPCLLMTTPQAGGIQAKGKLCEALTVQ